MLYRQIIWSTNTNNEINSRLECRNTGLFQARSLCSLAQEDFLDVDVLSVAVSRLNRHAVSNGDNIQTALNVQM